MVSSTLHYASLLHGSYIRFADPSQINLSGIEIHDGLYEYLIKEGKNLPAINVSKFRVSPGQSMITLNFHEGFAATAKEATLLGSLDFPLFNGMDACSTVSEILIQCDPLCPFF